MAKDVQNGSFANNQKGSLLLLLPLEQPCLGDGGDEGHAGQQGQQEATEGAGVLQPKAPIQHDHDGCQHQQRDRKGGEKAAARVPLPKLLVGVAAK